MGLCGFYDHFNFEWEAIAVFWGMEWQGLTYIFKRSFWVSCVTGRVVAMEAGKLAEAWEIKNQNQFNLKELPTGVSPTLHVRYKSKMIPRFLMGASIRLGCHWINWWDGREKQILKGQKNQELKFKRVKFEMPVWYLSEKIK